MIILGKPLFIWFGITGFFLIITTAILGFTGKFKYHKIFALISILFLVMHILGVLRVY
ncbi:MAG: hypothetical protein PHE88_11125 [Elusimicrobia bacterium]|nr:hypothetical protein [Elusimicrobiota bacterium]